MKFNYKIVTSVVAVALTCAATAAAYYFSTRKQVINEVMIFCKLQLNVFDYFDKLLNFINSAKRKVSVCMPSIHNPAFQGILVQLIKQKNIQVQIIIDPSGFNSSTAGFLKELVDAGADIKWKLGEEKMLHKFCLIDDEVLMTGTLDWGNDLSCDNWNYVYVTNKSHLVQPVKEEFSKLWEESQINLIDLIKSVANNSSEDSSQCFDKETEESDECEMLEPEISEPIPKPTSEMLT